MSSKPISKDIFDFLDTLPAKQAQQISKKILKLFNEPLPTDSIPLTGYKTYRRVDIGEYRICYTYINNELSVDLVGKRNDNDIYKKLSRK
jgi:mRNA interferase RelE/StbE